MFPWWLGNDLHLLFINIVSFQGYGLSENTISGTLVAAFSLRSPPGFSPMVLSTIEGSHGWDNDSRWSFHEHTHHVDRLHGNINILPRTEGFDRAKFISGEFYWQSSFFLQRHNRSCCCPSRAITAALNCWERWTEELRRCPAGPGFWGWASGAAQRCWIRFGSGKFFSAEQQQQRYRLRLSLFVMFWLTGELGTKWSTWASQWWRPYSRAAGFVLGKCNLMNIIIDASHFLTSGFLLVFLCFIGEPDNPCVEDEAVGNFCGSKILEVTLFLLHSLPALRFSQNSFSH